MFSPPLVGTPSEQNSSVLPSLSFVSTTNNQNQQQQQKQHHQQTSNESFVTFGHSPANTSGYSAAAGVDTPTPQRSFPYKTSSTPQSTSSSSGGRSLLKSQKFGPAATSSEVFAGEVGGGINDGGDFVNFDDVGFGLRKRHVGKATVAKNGDLDGDGFSAPPPTASMLSNDYVEPLFMNEDERDALKSRPPTSMPSETDTGAQMIPTSTFLLSNDSNADEMSKWVIVYGFPAHCYDDILRRFETYGHIISYVPPPSNEESNWVCLKYVSRIQAEKALCQDGTFHHEEAANKLERARVILGVRRLDRAMAGRIGVVSDENGPVSIDYGAVRRKSTDSPGVQDGDRTNTSNPYQDQNHYDESILLGEKDILVPYKSSESSVCDKVLRWVFMW
eukprot:CAMPEP_0172495464 /NCGR_PEP_ID=MMETSP1066-20121228/71387_1 /TAXON_ID=671091 /ORGANISM="Coscinodiscus wailesii, Strain CCMP2513" /LENGTH=389 /DNA_ID=CAMNT_0013267153 /DNA_START=36 /DNA_END=1205 /DNA_ORIENTATION=-